MAAKTCQEAHGRRNLGRVIVIRQPGEASSRCSLFATRSPVPEHHSTAEAPPPSTSLAAPEGVMHCENPNCYCQSEVGLMHDGREFCSEHCLRDDAPQEDLCRCGHVGCSTAAEIELPDSQPGRE